ncbi:hypothetical protein B0J17DRAFT_677968 [Rhizoctonia solani]|nr:hypothetical protein B0J17DRAFT_677968 [Rhizoctonia solani]
MNSTFTRFRVQTALPLEPLKAWHAISPDLDIKFIEDLKDNIVQTLGLAEADGEIILELDGFALLPSSPVGVVRDGDIVTIRCKPRSDKRKATEAVDQPTKKQKTQSPAPIPSPTKAPPATTKQPSNPPVISKPGPSRPSALAKPAELPPKAVLSSSEDDTTSSDEDSSSEDDSGSSSESTTDSDSDSDSESSSDSDAGPAPQPIPRQPVPSTRQPSLSRASTSQPPPPRRVPSQPPVPPGQGKQTTKNRNARRRELRKHQAAGTASSPRATPMSNSAATTPAPASAVESIIATQVKASTPIAPAKNTNKNKRKGFDKDMAEAVATRITYGTPAPAPAPTAASVEPPARVSSPAVPTVQTKSRYTHYHVVPPSQRKDLPANVIVTSVDVEAVNGLDGVGEWFDGENRVEEETPTGDVAQSTPNKTSKKVDWELVDSEWEQRWNSFTSIGEEVWNNLRAGTMLAYKSLTIDPITCTPCTKIHVVRVISGPSPGAGEVECFFIERPGAGAIGFGFGVKFRAVSEPEDNLEDKEVGETRNVAFREVGEWKIVV